MRALKTSFDDPQIEVLAASPRREMLMSRLAGLGFRPIRAALPVVATGSTPLLVDTVSAPDLAESPIGRPDWLRPLVLLGSSALDGALPSDAIRMQTLDALEQLHSRLTLRARRKLAALEGELREATAKGFSERPAVSGPASQRAPERGVLFFGSLGQDFLTLSRGLVGRGLPATGALTWNNAYDYLRAGGFAILLVDARQLRDHRNEIARALGSCDAVTVIGLGRAADAPFLDAVVDFSRDPVGAVDLLVGLAERAPLSTRLRKVRLSSRSHDPQTGLYSEAFLRAHLALQMPALSIREIPQSLLNLRLRQDAFDRPGLGRALDRLAELAIACLRETDLVCRFESCSLLANLPGASHGEAVRIAQRMKDAADRDAIIGKTLMWRASERREAYSSEQFVFAALNGPFSRPIAA